MISTGNPCPICRDEYLVLDYRNVDLLKQFISPFNGAILPTKYVFIEIIKFSQGKIYECKYDPALIPFQENRLMSNQT